VSGQNPTVVNSALHSRSCVYLTACVRSDRGPTSTWLMRSLPAKKVVDAGWIDGWGWVGHRPWTHGSLGSRSDRRVAPPTCSHLISTPRTCTRTTPVRTTVSIYRSGTWFALQHARTARRHGPAVWLSARRGAATAAASTARPPSPWLMIRYPLWARRPDGGSAGPPLSLVRLPTTPLTHQQ